MIALKIRIDTRIVNARVRSNLSGFQTGNRRDRLERRAGRIRACNRAVEQRCQLVCRQLFIVLVKCSQIIGRIVRQCKNFAVANVYHGSRAALCAANALAAPCQRLLRNLLQVGINGQNNIVAGLCLLGFFLAHNVAAGIGLNGALAIRAAQIFLKRLLRAGLADLRVHGVAIVLVLVPVLCKNRAGVSQNVGCHIALNLAFCRSLYFYAGIFLLLLAHAHNKIHRNVGCQCKRIVHGELFLFHLIANADNLAGVRIAQTAVHFIQRAQIVHNRIRIEIFSPFLLGTKRLQALVIRGILILCEGERTAAAVGNRQRIIELCVILCVYQIDQLQNAVILSFFFPESIGNTQLIHGFIGYQCLTVSIQNIAARCRNGVCIRVQLARFAGVFIAMNDLQRKQIRCNNQAAQQSARCNNGQSV